LNVPERQIRAATAESSAVQLQQTYAPARNSKKRLLLLLIIKTILIIKKKKTTKMFIITLRES
jgi:hypothetical protein